MDRRILRNLDWGLTLAVAAIIGLGLLTIYSATAANPAYVGSTPWSMVIKQAMGVVLGAITAAFVVYTDYRVYGRFYRIIYLVNLGMLLLVLVLGHTVSGTTGWFRLGPIRFQPAELAKIAVIVTFAKHLEKRTLFSLRDLIPPFIHVAVPMLFILRQPDFGTAMVFSAIFLGMLYVAGAPTKYLVGVMFTGLGVMVGAVYLSQTGILQVFKDYQIQRFLVFLDPYSDPVNSGYNVIQSMIAIGSGRFFGNGLLGGSQTQLRFLPANHTDFIFAVLGEAFGFLGAFVLLSLYGFILWRGLRITFDARDRLGALMAAGMVSMLFFHILINVGMTLGIMPVTGIPLPFMSYGPSSMIANLIGIGLLLNVHARRQKIRF